MVTRTQLAALAMGAVFLPLLLLGAMWLTQNIPASVQRPVAAAPSPAAGPVNEVPRNAELPWLRDIDAPTPVAANLAVCLWNGRDAARSPAMVSVSLATTPWDAPVTPARRKR